MGRKNITPEQAAFNKYMGERLRHYREQANLKRYPLSKQINVTPIMIKRYEEGLWQIPLATLVLICKVLGNCTVKDFIPDIEQKDKIDVDSQT